MTNWVLPGILKADEVLLLPYEFIVELSKISTGVIMDYVNKFIATNMESSDPTSQQAASILSSAYEEVNKVNEYLNSDEAKTLSNTLCSLQYSDISSEIPMEKLIVYRSTILELLVEDEDFVANYNRDMGGAVSTGNKTAYTTKLDGSNYESVMERMQSKEVCAGKEILCDTVCKRISQNENLFKNSRAKLNSATVLRKALYKKDRLKSILRGLDYLIDKKKSGEPPRSWRRV